MAIFVPPAVKITPTTHRFFDDLVTALASNAALTAGLLTQRGPVPYRFGDDWASRIRCLTRREGNETLEIEFIPAQILSPLTRRGWPTSLDLKFGAVREVGIQLPPPAPPTPVTSPLQGMQRMSANIFEHAFVAYNEHYSDDIHAARSKVSGDVATLAFANVIRNAFAHGGVINFTKKNAHVTVTWGGLSYSIQDNGRQVMYNDISMGDVILLMLEMDPLF